jgi:hypothetical protein
MSRELFEDRAAETVNAIDNPAVGMCRDGIEVSLDILVPPCRNLDFWLLFQPILGVESVFEMAQVSPYQIVSLAKSSLDRRKIQVVKGICHAGNILARRVTVLRRV